MLITSWAHRWSLRRRRRREGKKEGGCGQGGQKRSRGVEATGGEGQPWAAARTEEASGEAGQQRCENREVEA